MMVSRGGPRVGLLWSTIPQTLRQPYLLSHWKDPMAIEAIAQATHRRPTTLQKNLTNQFPRGSPLDLLNNPTMKATKILGLKSQRIIGIGRGIHRR
jgi:hypothetical protein